MAKAVQFSAFGPNYLDNVKLVDVPIPEPAAGEVLVQAYLRPVHPTDILFQKGGYGTGFSLPRVPGSEGVARVVKNGAGANKFKEGQRVVAVQWPLFTKGPGSWTTHAALPEDVLVAVPDGVSDEAAAQFFINPVTVFGILKELAVPKGEWLLQTAATSVLGGLVVSLAKHYGIRTINVVRRADAVQELKEAGADEVIVSETEDIAARVAEITGGKGAYAAMDPVGGPQAAQVVAAVRQCGVYLTYGRLDPSPLQVSASDLIVGQKTMRGFILYEWINRPDKQAVLQEVMKLLEDKVLVLTSGKAYPLEEFKDAIAASQASARGAKVFLRS